MIGKVQRLTLEDGCNVDQNFFGHKTEFFVCGSVKVNFNSYKFISIYFKNCVLKYFKKMNRNEL